MINPAGVLGQVQGAVSQAIGYTLYESLRMREGKFVEDRLETYRLPLAVDIPDIEFIPMNHPTEDGPHGIRGVAEPAILLAPAVIANAVSDAVGVPFYSTPITPEHILKAICNK